MNAVPFSPARAALIAGQTFREAVRQRLPCLLLALLAASAGAALVMRDFRFGSSEEKFILDAGFGAEAMFGAILAVVVTAQFFTGETERRTVLMVLAKPVRRAEFVLGKYGGVLLLLLIFCAAMTGLLAGLLWWRRAPLASAGDDSVGAGSLAVYGGVVVCGLVQWLKLGVLAAFTLLVASYARSSLVAVTTGFAVLVVGHLHHLARDFYASAGPTWAAAGARLVSLALPDFQLFNVADQVEAGGPWPGGMLAGITCYALAYMGVLCALAVCCFRRREL